MYPEDRVLVGVINRKRDLNYAVQEHWYRIPVKRLQRGIETEYVAFFLSGKTFKEMSGGIHYFARVRGFELAYRRQLLPKEADHPRADDQYYRLSLEKLQLKQPPILNPTRRPISFIFTTWDRFLTATTISHLYSAADHFVERIKLKLNYNYLEIDQLWDAQSKTDEYAPGIRISSSSDVQDRRADRREYVFSIDRNQGEDRILSAIRAEIEQIDGPVTINIPFD